MPVHHQTRRRRTAQAGNIPVGQILVIGLIVVPLVLTLILFKDDVEEFLKEQWDKLSGSEKEGTW